jgi:uncharacterized membrane protein YgcG
MRWTQKTKHSFLIDHLLPFLFVSTCELELLTFYGTLLNFKLASYYTNGLTERCRLVVICAVIITLSNKTPVQELRLILFRCFKGYLHRINLREVSSVTSRMMALDGVTYYVLTTELYISVKDWVKFVLEPDHGYSLMLLGGGGGGGPGGGGGAGRGGGGGGGVG